MGVRAARRALAPAEEALSAEHAGLALQRYLPEQDEKSASAALLLCKVAATEAGPAYRAAFARWRGVQQQRTGCSVFTGELAGPLAVGLGGESVLEVGLTVQHTYGMPLIPGAALKGLCRRGAGSLKREGALEETAFRVLFGDTKMASYFVFWDAWYDPESAGGTPFRRDVVTVHHPGYYTRQEQRPWPTDFDDPNPVPFLTVRPGARFLFALDAPSAEWGEFAARLLRWSLEHLGAGGKTNAGFGRFQKWMVPPRRETWPNCGLRRLIVKGAVEVHVEGGRAPLTIQQRDWQPVESALTAEQKEALRRGRLRATLRVEREGASVRLLGIAEVTTGTGPGGH
jgi:CRISPR-associated protein Cmr6